MPLSLLRVFHGIRFYFKESGTVKSRFSALKAELFIASALKAELFLGSALKAELFIASAFKKAELCGASDL